MVNGKENGNGTPKARLGIGCVRVSTDRQERSIDEQKAEIRAAAVKDGVAVLEDLWCEDEGISGSILNRPGLSRLLALCRTRQDVTDVYFWKRNRLARSVDPLDGMNVEREIERHGKRVHFVQGIQKTGNKLIDSIASVLEYAEAGQYLVNLSTDTIRGLVPLTKQGFDAGRPTPYGYDRLVMDSDGKETYRVRNLEGDMRQQIFPDGQVRTYKKENLPSKAASMHSTLVLGDPTRVAVVRRIFEMFVKEDMGIRSILDELNGKGIPAARGGLWTLGAVRSILLNPVYTGANIWNVRNFSKYHKIVNGAAVSIESDSRSVRYNDEEQWIVSEGEKGFPAIISREVFRQAQAKRKQRNNSHARGRAAVTLFYLSGIMVCSCGNTLHGHTKKSGRKKGFRPYFYYMCGGFSRNGKVACRRYLLPRDVIEGGVIEALARRIRSLARVEEIRKQVRALLADEGVDERKTESGLRRRIAELETGIRNWEEAIEKGHEIDKAVARIKVLADEKKSLERDLALVRSRTGAGFDAERISQEILANLDRLEEVLKTGAVTEAKALLRAYIGRVEYDPVANKAKVGFYRVPQGVMESLPGRQDSPLFSILAGGGFDTKNRCLEWEVDTPVLRPAA